RMNVGLMVVDIEHVPTSIHDFDRTLRLVLRDARFHQALLYLENFDVLLDVERAIYYRQLLKVLNEDSSMTILVGEKPLKSLAKIHELHFPVQNFEQRRACWADNLREHGVTLDAETLDALASSFRLPCGEILAAVAAAFDLASLRAAVESSSEMLSQADAKPTA